MKFVLEVDVPAGDAAGELGRILRHWAANLQHHSLAPGTGSTIYDSGNSAVGRWHIVGGRGTEDVEEAFDDFEAYASGTDEEAAPVEGGYQEASGDGAEEESEDGYQEAGDGYEESAGWR